MLDGQKKGYLDKEDVKKIFRSNGVRVTEEDLDAAFPAKFPRVEMGWDKVAMMCFHELPVPNSLKMCLRVLVVVNCDEDFEPEFVYLKGAEILRK